MTCNLGKPCHDCAFRRDSTPGNLGGSPALTYIGQAVGPFIVPCHMTYPEGTDLSKREHREKSLEWPQCAGMAVFRANVGVAHMLPDMIHKLPADHELVFSTFAEFLAHHERVRLVVAQHYLNRVETPVDLLRKQLAKPEVVTRPIKEGA